MKKVVFEKLLCEVETMMTNLLYYDRKEDDDLTLDDVSESMTEEQKDIFLAEVRRNLQGKQND